MISEKKTKIVATIGPKTEDKASLKKLLKAGMNVIRMNFFYLIPWSPLPLVG